MYSHVYVRPSLRIIQICRFTAESPDSFSPPLRRTSPAKYADSGADEQAPLKRILSADFHALRATSGAGRSMSVAAQKEVFEAKLADMMKPASAGGLMAALEMNVLRS